MKKLLLSFCLAVCIAEYTFSQITFQKTIGGAVYSDVSNSFQQINGGYIIAGYTGSFGAGNDVYLIRTDLNANIIWTKSFGGIDPDAAFSVKQTTDGGFILTGSTRSFGAGNEDIYLIKVDSSGTLLWSKTFGGTEIDIGYSVQPTVDGGLIVSGRTNSFNSASDDLFLIKTDATGNLQWSNRYGSTQSDIAYSMQQTSDGGYIMAGQTYSFGNIIAEIYVVKTDSSGNVLWAKTYGGPNDDRAFYIQQTNDGSYIITGFTNSFGAGNIDALLIKINSAGNILWSKTYGGVLDDFNFGGSVNQTNDGGFILAGATNTFGAGYIDVYLIKSDSLGNLLWSKTFGGITGDICNFVQSVNDGGYVIAGYTQGFGFANTDVYLIKTDSSGFSGCNESNPPTITTTPTFIVINPLTNIIPQVWATTIPINFIDSGGVATTLCSTVDVNELIENITFQIYPNPFTSEISITLLKQNIKQATFTIKNILGQTVFSKELKTPNNQTHIDLSFLSKGIYLLEVIVDGERAVKKIVKE